MEQTQTDNRSNSIGRNISYNTVITVVTYLFGALTTMYVSRALQPVANGRVEFANSLIHYFVLVAGFGMPLYALRVCSRCRDDREKLGRVFSELLSISLVFAAAVAALLVVLTLTVDPFRENRTLMLILGSAVVWNAVGCEWFFKSLERYRYLMVVALVTRVASFVLVLLAVRSPEDMTVYACLFVLSQAASALCNIFVLAIRRPVRFRFRFNRQHIKPLFVFFATSCMATIYVSLDTVMLGFLKGDYATGLYGLISKGRTLLTCFGGVLWAATVPQVTIVWKEGQFDRFREITRKSIGLIMAVNLALMTFALVFAEDCVRAMGGASYLEAVPAFRVMVLAVAPIGLSNVLGGQVLIPAGRENRLVQAEAIGAVVNLALNLYVIPRYSILGASATTLVAELVVWLLCLRVDVREVGLHRKDTLPDVRTAIACAIAAVPAWFVKLPLKNVFLRLAGEACLFFAVYALVALALGEPTFRGVFARLRGTGVQGRRQGKN